MAGEPLSDRRRRAGFPAPLHVLATHLRREPRSQSRPRKLRYVSVYEMKYLSAVLFLYAPLATAQDIAAGKKQFESRCAGCHGIDGAGGEHAPSIVDTRRRGGGDRAQPDLRDTITKGIPEGGMP